jgi:hypothetical protein
MKKVPPLFTRSFLYKTPICKWQWALVLLETPLQVSSCKKNDLFYQSICYPIRLLKNSSGCHLKWLACLKGPCFFFWIPVRSIAAKLHAQIHPPRLLASWERLWTFGLDKSQVTGRYNCIRDIRRSHCQPLCTCMLLSRSEHMLAPSWSRENCLVKIFCLLCVCFRRWRVINSNILNDLCWWWAFSLSISLCFSVQHKHFP